MLDETKLMLEIDRRTLPVLARELGVSLSWIKKFKAGDIANPGYFTIKKLHQLLLEQQQGRAA